MRGGRGRGLLRRRGIRLILLSMTMMTITSFEGGGKVREIVEDKDEENEDLRDRF